MHRPRRADWRQRNHESRRSCNRHYRTIYGPNPVETDHVVAQNSQLNFQSSFADRSSTIRMYNEETRLLSFQGRWSNPSIPPEELARWGFFYTGERDVVMCAFCQGCLQDWRSCDDPRAEHLSIYPDCPFILGCEAQRVTMDGSSNLFHNRMLNNVAQHGTMTDLPHYTYQGVLHVARTSAPVHETQPEDENTMNEHAVSRQNSDHSHLAQKDAQSLSSLPNFGVQVDVPYCKMSGPRRQNNGIDQHLRALNVITSTAVVDNMVVFQNRLRTFDHWPPDKKQKPEDLAKFGFYFTGEKDRIRCFYCGLALHRWQPTDDAWAAHEYYNPGCDYLAITKNLCDDSQNANNSTVRVNTANEAENEPKFEQFEPADIKATLVELNEKTPCWRGELVVRFAFDCGYDEDMIVKALITNNYVVFDNECDLIERLGILQLVEKNAGNRNPQNETADGEPTTSLSRNPRSKHGQNHESNLCQICMDVQVSVVFLPCCHLVCCPRCSPAIKKCPICRTDCQGRLRIYV